MDDQRFKDRFPRWAKDAANLVTRRYGLATAAFRPLPDFLIIGTKRGGTTSLFNYLLLHPGVLGLFPQPRGRKSTDYFFSVGHRDEAWYRSHFHTSAHRTLLRRRLGYAPVAGEASPFYAWDPRVAGHVKRAAPAVKAIFLLRDPVERAWSHYQERRSNGVESLSFAEALEAEDDRTAGELNRMRRDPAYYSQAYDWYSYRARGVYLPQLRNWLEHFPAESLLILRSEDMYADAQTTFDEVCRFLGIPAVRLPTTRAFNANKASEMPPDAREELSRFYLPHNAELEDHLRRPMGWQ